MEYKIMSPKELTEAEIEWKKGRGISPLAGNNNDLTGLAERGTINREVLGVLKNGIAKIGYSDRQGRVIAVTHETPDGKTASERYLNKIVQINAKFNIEQSRKIREKFGDDTTVINARAKELLLKDVEE